MKFINSFWWFLHFLLGDRTKKSSPEDQLEKRKKKIKQFVIQYVSYVTGSSVKKVHEANVCYLRSYELIGLATMGWQIDPARNNADPTLIGHNSAMQQKCLLVCFQITFFPKIDFYFSSPFPLHHSWVVSKFRQRVTNPVQSIDQIYHYVTFLVYCLEKNLKIEEEQVNSNFQLINSEKLLFHLNRSQAGSWEKPYVFLLWRKKHFIKASYTIQLKWGGEFLLYVDNT